MPYKELHNYIHNYIISIVTSFKNELVIITALFFAFTSPIHGLVYTVGGAVVMDTVFGLYKAWKLKIQIESNLLLNFFVKTFFYMGCIFLGLLISTYITNQQLFGITFFVPKFLCGVALLIEGKSMDETSVKLGNKPILEVIKGAVTWLKSFKKDINEIK